MYKIPKISLDIETHIGEARKLLRQAAIEIDITDKLIAKKESDQKQIQEGKT